MANNEVGIKLDRGDVGQVHEGQVQKRRDISYYSEIISSDEAVVETLTAQVQKYEARRSLCLIQVKSLLEMIHGGIRLSTNHCRACDQLSLYSVREFYNQIKY